ncbi:WD40 repeat-like protein, partial [Dichomitus squalens LYAD-421 SS1]|uniref:WD40 repeat-like protein n=1 Tax=Dichomitus squalens (strain LYAD-421) TaxID=732165 RepID=UPI000441088D
HNGEVLDLGFAPDGRHLASAGADGEVAIWDISGGSSYKVATLEGHTASMSPGCAWSSSGARIASRDPDGTVLLIRVWDIATQQEYPLCEAHGGWLNTVVFSPDGRLLLSASRATVQIRDARAGAMDQSFDGHETLVHQACFSPCGRFIASASSDRTVRVWRTSDGSCLATLSDHGG